MELEEGVGLASVLAGTDDGTLETLGVFGIEDDDDVAAVDGLGNQDRECDALAGLRSTGNARSAFEVHKRAIKRALFRFDAMDVREPNLVVGLWMDLVAQESK